MQALLPLLATKPEVIKCSMDNTKSTLSNQCIQVTKALQLPWISAVAQVYYMMTMQANEPYWISTIQKLIVNYVHSIHILTFQSSAKFGWIYWLSHAFLWYYNSIHISKVFRLLHMIWIIFCSEVVCCLCIFMQIYWCTIDSIFWHQSIT